MDDALRQRPDILVRLSEIRAADQGIALARSELYPKLSVAANLQGNVGQLRTDDSPYSSVKQPQYGVYLRFDWTLYQGGARLNRLKLEQSRRSQAEAALQQASAEALREVALAYDALQTGLARNDAAIVFRDTAKVAFDAATSAYAHGVGTLTDAANAQTSLAGGAGSPGAGARTGSGERRLPGVCDRRPHLGGRPCPGGRAMRRLSAAIPLAAAGCTAAPAQAIVGSYFPSWIICVVAGIVVAAVMRQLFVLMTIENHLLLPPLTYAGIALAACLSIWLFWFGQ